MSDHDPQIRNGDDYFPLFSKSAEHLAARIEAHPAEGVLLRWQELSWFPVLVMAGKHSLWRWHWIHIGRELASDRPGREWMGRDKTLRHAALLAHYVFQWLVALALDVKVILTPPCIFY